MVIKITTFKDVEDNKRISKDSYYTFAITNKKPGWCRNVLRSTQPTYKLQKEYYDGVISFKEYFSKYKKQIDRKQLIAELNSVQKQYPMLILFCDANFFAFSHRKVVAEILREENMQVLAS